MRRGIRVRRVVRRFELWSVAKVAFFFHLFCYLLTLVVLTALWLANDRLGTVDKIESLFVQYGFGDNFQIHGDVLLRVVASVGAVMVLVATIATIALAFFYNGISLVFGGLVVSVLEERPAPRPVAPGAEATAELGSDGTAPRALVQLAEPGSRRARKRRRKAEQQAQRAAREAAKKTARKSGRRASSKRPPVPSPATATDPWAPGGTASSDDTWIAPGPSDDAPTGWMAPAASTMPSATPPPQPGTAPAAGDSRWDRPASWLDESVSGSINDDTSV